MQMLRILTLLFGLSIVGIASFRLMIDYQLSILQKDPHSRKRVKKIILLKHKEHRQHTRFLFLLFLAGSVSLGVLTFTNLALHFDYQRVKRESDQVMKQIAIVEAMPQQEAIPPERQLLKRKEWKKMFEESRKESKKTEIERALSQQAMRYFDHSEVVVTLDETKKAVTIRIIGSVETHERKEKLKRQMRGFVQSVDESFGLLNVHIGIVSVIGEDESVVYSADYTRKEEKETFKKVNDFERDVKLGGEKG